MFIDFIDLFGLLVDLLIFLFLVFDLCLHFIDHAANSEVYLPEDAFEKGAVDEDDHEVHQHEERDNKAVELLVMPAVVIDYFGPGSFSQDLHHEILGVDEGLEVGELGELTIRGGFVSVLFSVVEDLHA